VLSRGVALGAGWVADGLDRVDELVSAGGRRLRRRSRPV